MRRVLAALVLALFTLDAVAGQWITRFDGNGNILPGAYDATTGKLADLHGGWVQGTAGGASRATTAGVNIGANQGAKALVRTTATATTALTAAEVAGGMIKGLRGGLLGIAASAAADIALSHAHLLWDKTQQSMVYNPAASQDINAVGGSVGQTCGGVGSGYASVSAAIADCKAAYTRQQAPSVIDVTMGSPLSANPGFFKNKLIISKDGAVWRDDQAVFGQLAGGSNPNPMTCPNGVVWDNVNTCKQPVPDLTGQGYLGPSLSANPTDAPGFLNADGALPTGGPSPLNAPTVTMPTSVTSSTPYTTTTINPDGTRSTSTTTSKADSTCTGNTCTSNITNNTTVTVTNNAGNVTSTTTTTETPGDAAPNPDETKPCGLTDGTACKIDGSGTKDAMQPAQKNADAASTAFDQRVATLGTIGSSGNAGGLGVGGLGNFQAPTSSDAPGILNQALPDGNGCQALATSYHSLTLDWCPVVYGIRPVIDWFAACLTAFALWSVWANRKRSTT
jgi:hypothetical protein